MFGLDIGSIVKQTATFILAVIFIFAALPNGVLNDVIGILSSLNVPNDWKIGFGIFGGICFTYTVIK